MLNMLYTFQNRPAVLSLLITFMTGALLTITGMWITVQFRFIQMQYPAVVLAFERQVLTASLPIAAVMQAVGIAAVTELGDVPYYLCAVLCMLYFVLGRPLESSFHQSKAGRAIGGKAAVTAEAIVQVMSMQHCDCFLIRLCSTARCHQQTAMPSCAGSLPSNRVLDPTQIVVPPLLFVPAVVLCQHTALPSYCSCRQRWTLSGWQLL